MSQKILNSIIYLTIFSLLLYLVRFEISWVPFNLSEILIYFLFLVWLFWGNKDRSMFSCKIWLPVLLIFLSLTVSTLLSSDLEVSAGIWKGWFLAPLLFFVVVINQIKTQKQIRNVLISLTASGLGVALISFYYLMTGILTYDNRLAGPYTSANYLAMYLSPILILSLFLYSFLRKKSDKILLLAVQFLLLLTICLTFSYGAWLGIFGALIFIVFSRKDKKLGLALLLLIVLVLVLQIPSQKFQGLADLSYPSLKSRLVIWQSAWEIIKDNPWIGIGPGMFQEYYLSYQDRFEPYPEWAAPQPHNIFLAFWLQTGLLGLIGFIWLLVLFFKKTDPRKILGSVLIGAMIYILIHGLVDTTYWKNDLSVLFWLITALSCKAIRFSG